MHASVFIAASAAIILMLGLVHLLYTFRGSKLHPRGAECGGSCDRGNTRRQQDRHQVEVGLLIERDPAPLPPTPAVPDSFSCRCGLAAYRPNFNHASLYTVNPLVH